MFGATDAYALRAAIESSQYYSQPLLTRLANDNAAASLPSRQSHDLLGLNSSMNLNLHSDLLAYANGSRLGASFATNEANHNGGTLLSGSTNLSSSVNQGIMNADAGSLALTRHYLQLLQTQQDAATLAQLAGAGSHVETATAASHLANERRDEYRE